MRTIRAEVRLNVGHESWLLGEGEMDEDDETGPQVIALLRATTAQLEAELAAERAAQAGVDETHGEAITEDLLVYRAMPGRFDVHAGHVVVAVEGCTCDGPHEGYGHRPECGYEPVLTVAEFRALSEEDLGRLLRTAGLAPATATDGDGR